MIVLVLGHSLFDDLLVDQHNKGALLVDRTLFTTAHKKHGDLVHFHHDVREKILVAMEGLLCIENHRLATNGHISAETLRLLPHTSFL